MDDFLDKLSKIRSDYFKRSQLLFILDIIAISSIFYAIFIIFNLAYFLNKSFSSLSVLAKIIPPVLAIVIAIFGALLLHRKDRRINIPLLIENKYPELKEKLRTAYDNRNETNIIVDSLKTQVSEAMNRVSSSQILAKGKILSKIIVTIIFIAGTVMLSLNSDKYSIPPDVITNFSNTITGNTGTDTNGSIEVAGRNEDSNNAGKNGGGDIFGKPKIAPIEGKPVDLSLDQGSGQGNTPNQYNPDNNQFIQSAAFPVDIQGSNVSDGGYGILMKRSETEKELINKYAVERSKI